MYNSVASRGYNEHKCQINSSTDQENCEPLTSISLVLSHKITKWNTWTAQHNWLSTQMMLSQMFNSLTDLWHFANRPLDHTTTQLVNQTNTVSNTLAIHYTCLLRLLQPFKIYTEHHINELPIHRNFDLNVKNYNRESLMRPWLTQCLQIHVYKLILQIPRPHSNPIQFLSLNMAKHTY